MAFFFCRGDSQLSQASPIKLNSESPLATGALNEGYRNDLKEDLRNQMLYTNDLSFELNCICDKNLNPKKGLHSGL